MTATKIDYRHGFYEEIKPEYKKFDEAHPEWWAMKYADRWEVITEIKKPLSLLDVGCGRGRALSYFSKYVPSIGVEPSVYASNQAKERGLAVINGYFMDVDINQAFDVVHIEQVLSHAPDFKDMLCKAHELLNDGGVIVIEEPNDESPLQKLLEKERGKYWITPDHCNYFNYETLAQHLLDTGFEIKVKMGTYPMELFELAGDRYIGDEVAGRWVHGKRVNIEKSMPSNLRIEMQKIWAELGIGRDIVIFANKKGASK